MRMGGGVGNPDPLRSPETPETIDELTLLLSSLRAVLVDPSLLTLSPGGGVLSGSLPMRLIEGLLQEGIREGMRERAAGATWSDDIHAQ